MQLRHAPGVRVQRDADEIAVHQLPAAALLRHDALDLGPDGGFDLRRSVDVLGEAVGLKALVRVEAEAHAVEPGGAEGLAGTVPAGVRLAG